ncbi:IclR family transcriptional regulator [Rhodococcus koreensis]
MVESVHKALILLTVIRDQGGMRLRDAARELGVADSTAHRLLATLAYHGFVVQDSNRRYLPGHLVGVGPAGTESNRALLEACLPELKRLSSTTKETVNVVVRTGILARTIASVESPRLLRIGSRLGHVTQARFAAGGKALLAELAPSAVRSLHHTSNFDEDDFERLGPAELQHLLQELQTVRDDGFATSVDEVEAGLASVGVCIREHDVAVAALVVALPSSRVRAALDGGVVRQIRLSSSRIESSLCRRMDGC